MNKVAEGLSSRQGSLIVKTSHVGLADCPRQEVRGKVGQEIRVYQNSSEEVNRLDETLSNDHFATSAKKDNIWVIATIHQDTIIAEELAI